MSERAGKYFAPLSFRTRLPALDGVRAIAIVLVFMRHYGGGSHGGLVLRALNVIRERGWLGVDIFFVLSGFLITGILYDTTQDSHYFERFFARRSVRIFPVYLLVAAVLLLLTPVFHYQWRWAHLSYLFYLGNFFGNADPTLWNIKSLTHPWATVEISHFWSLCVEEQFYLLWPLAVWLIRDRRKLIWTAAGLSILALLLRSWMSLHFSYEIAERWGVRTLPFRMDTLLIGGVLALLLRGPGADKIQKSCKWVLLGGILAVAAVFRWDASGYNLLTYGYTLLAIASAGLVGSALAEGTPLFKALYWKPVRTLGKYSYGFYVFHLLYRPATHSMLVHLIGKLHSLALGGAVTLGLTFLFTFVLAMLSYNLFEVKFLRLKRRFEYDSEIAEHKHAFVTK